jgi:hypothetical protein
MTPTPHGHLIPALIAIAILLLVTLIAIGVAGRGVP